jgi:hypothetical protein
MAEEYEDLVDLRMRINSQSLCETMIIREGIMNNYLKKY